MRPGGQARRASISGIFEPARPMFSAPLTGCSAGRMYRYIELRTLGDLYHFRVRRAHGRN